MRGLMQKKVSYEDRHLRRWDNCVISGALRVAKFQFMCRTPFQIGDTIYLGDGVTEEQHLAMINDEVDDDELKCSGRVLKEIFSEEKLVLVYRYSFEIEKAKSIIDLNVRPPVDAQRNDVSVGDIGDINYNLHGIEDHIQHQRQGWHDNPLHDLHPTCGEGPPESHISSSNLPRPRSPENGISKDATLLKPTWAHMEVGSDYWKTVSMENCDNIINLSSDLHFEDNSTPLRNNAYIEIEASSIGSNNGTEVNQFPT
ncbi:hypothetical protein Bca52824_040951 [Brassica carinata]|uniref:Uncharacterized protein n=3 Tax=Brassica TaxID=3705 RepID=A0A8X7RUG5_BRACI|nr:hypothetical protein Bca52824_040951 [Brassica carinata]